VPRTKPLLLHAARTKKGEDRLTEVLAVVLAGHEGLAHRLLKAAGLPFSGAVEVSTQVRTERGKYVDLQLVALDGKDRAVLSRLWSEHKTGSDYSPDQLEGYAADLQAMHQGPRRLITVVNHSSDATVDPRWDVFTWDQVALLAEEQGRADEGTRWRDAATAGAAPARLRFLHELLTYLEEKHHAVTNPISHIDILALAQANETSEKLTGLLERAADLSRLEPDGGYGWDKSDLGTYWQLFKLPGGWHEPLGGHAELAVFESDSWSFDRLDEPAFGAGVSLPAKLYEQLRDASRTAWREGLASEGVAVTDTEDGVVRCYRTLYVAELISKGATVDAQATWLGRWAADAVELIVSRAPQPPLKSA
jgi:DNA-binding protein